MMWRDQIEARTNAANTSEVWKYLKLSEKDAKIIASREGCTILDFYRYTDIFAWYRYISFLFGTPSLSCAEIISKMFFILVSFNKNLFVRIK